ncbi:hypothetical protein A0J61_00142 [Choanephora cucurbitarum]|uniref:Uncharacterized protein n=1 Tax=Choanephora cucurbitarum TaxID=101091 RepID=A0A1C7NS69_9FUNG|nr:hypothetical protein A0J61_00142 [Choanephora cucurbitarum]
MYSFFNSELWKNPIAVGDLAGWVPFVDSMNKTATVRQRRQHSSQGKSVKCYTLSSQATNYYRYGTKKDCSGKWDDFKFCLKTKTKPVDVADAMLRERKAAKEAVKKQGRSSEEVWEARQ